MLSEGSLIEGETASSGQVGNTTAGNDFTAVAVGVCHNKAVIVPDPAFSGLVWFPDIPDIGHSLAEGDLLYFYSWEFVMSFNLDTGEWLSHMPTGGVYIDWPFYYESDPGILWFALPPAGGIGVYHFSTGQLELLPRIIPW